MPSHGDPSQRPLVEGLPFDDAWFAEQAFSPEGVDRTLIREALRLTPTQRLEALAATLRDLMELCSGTPPAPRR